MRTVPTQVGPPSLARMARRCATPGPGQGGLPDACPDARGGATAAQRPPARARGRASGTRLRARPATAQRRRHRPRRRGRARGVPDVLARAGLLGLRDRRRRPRGFRRTARPWRPVTPMPTSGCGWRPPPAAWLPDATAGPRWPSGSSSALQRRAPPCEGVADRQGTPVVRACSCYHEQLWIFMSMASKKEMRNNREARGSRACLIRASNSRLF